MGNGTNPVGADGPGGGFLGWINSSLENRLLALFLAAILGTTGGVGINSMFPEARSDAYTGTMANERARLVDERLRALDSQSIAFNREHEARIDALEALQRLDNEARISISELARRLNEVEEDVSRAVALLDGQGVLMSAMREDIRELLRRMLAREQAD